MEGMPGGPARNHLPAAALLLALSMAAAAPPALADGAFFKGGAFPAPPPIPAQRALVVHRDGVETLVVESTLDAEGQTFGWILPVPARPLAMEPCTPGALDTLDLATRPRIERRGYGGVSAFLAGMVLVLCLAVWMYRRGTRAPSTLSRRITESTVVLASLLLLLMVMVPNLLAAKLGDAPVDVTGLEAATQRVGHYEVAVLEARDPAALDRWLDAAGLAGLPEAGVSVVEEYIAEGWLFLAARLAREGAGPLAPHPLSVTFPSADPVYPMRLTALAGGTTDLRVHVAAEGSAACPPLVVGFSGRFEEGSAVPAGLYDEERHPMLVQGDHRGGRRIAHPALRDLLWDGCVLTRLEGPLDARDMDRDLVFAVGMERPALRVLYTPSAAWGTAFLRVSWLWALAMLVLVALPDPILSLRGERPRAFLLWGLVLTAGAAVAAAGVRATLGTVPEEGVVRGEPPWSLSRTIRRTLAEEGGYEGKDAAAVRALLAEKFRDLRNPYTGRPLAHGDSPGDFEVLTDQRGPVVRLRSLEGAPLERVWHLERLEALLRQHAMGPWPTVDEARAAIFPGGVLGGGVRNPFTGGPLHHGSAPGEAEVLDTGAGLALRAHHWDGTYTDLDLPRR